jgi:hypothetical protein
MTGAQVTNIRRTGIPATKKGKPNPEYPSIEIHGSPTPERLRMAGNDFALGGEDRGIKTYTMRDSPLDRIFARRSLSGSEYAALQKYFHHWHHAGLQATVGSVDLNRIFSSDPASMSGMAKTEAQAHHRKQWREARALIGIETGIVVDYVVCAGSSLEAAGTHIGYNSPFRAREAALKHVQRAGDMLERHWGLR